MRYRTLSLDLIRLRHCSLAYFAIARRGVKHGITLRLVTIQYSYLIQPVSAAALTTCRSPACKAPDGPYVRGHCEIVRL